MAQPTFCRYLVLVIVLYLFQNQAISQPDAAPPTVQDCLGAIPVCQPVYSTTNSYTGHGNVYPEIRNNSLCPLCMDGEKNDVFYIITVQTNGLLRFTLTPNNPSNDYDWSMFNMTSASCDRLYPDALELQVSCNSYGVTGTNGPTGINTVMGNNLNCNGPGTAGTKFNKDLTVHAGQTYLLNVSNWSATNQSGYTIDFSGSTASIYDVTPAVIDTIQEIVSCAGSDTLYARFSENVKCVDIYHHPEKFSLTGPAGTYTISDVLSPECVTGATNGRSCRLIVAPKLGAGDYTLTIIGDIRDLCDNVCTYQGFPFTLSEINAPIATAGNDTSVANGAVITLRGAVSGGVPPYSVHWEPASLLVNPNVMQPVTVNLGASVNYIMNVTDQAGCHGISDVRVTVVGGPLTVAASAEPGIVCPGEEVRLNAVVSGGSGNYTYAWSSVPPGFSSGLPDPVVFPMGSTVYHVQISDGFSTISGSTSVTVNPRPVASTGQNAVIPYGTSIQLNGSASGGSGSYSFYWTSVPPGYASSNPDPLFTNLTGTTLFRLVVTDLATGCVSIPAEVTVTVTGSPLSCQPVATPAVICRFASTQLRALAGGGSGNFTYAWSSSPGSFSSTQADPVVTPAETTVYSVTVTDGFNTATGTTVVQVRPLPDFSDWQADTLACIYETVVLDAGNPGSSWYWSNGATTRTIGVQTTGIGSDLQFYRVRVINEYGCLDSADVQVSFSFSACTGIDEQTADGGLLVYPNPGRGRFRLETGLQGAQVEITVTTLLGSEVIKDRINTPADGILSNEYDLSALPPGLYLIKVRSNQFSRMVKFVNR